MKTARHSARTICACALALLSMVPASLVYGAADDPVILDIGPYVDEEGFGGFLRVLVRAPADSSVVLKKASAPDDPVWTEVGVPLLSTGLPVDLAAPIDPGETEAFFRAEIVKTDMFVRDDGTWITFVNNDVAPVGTVLHRLSMFSGLPIFPRDDDTADNELPAVQVASMNVEDLLKNLGIDAWVGPPPRDDRAYAARFVPNEDDQPDPLPDDPGDVGEGRMESGFPDDPVLPIPEAGSDDPPVPDTSGDMPFMPEIPDVPDRVIQMPIPGYQPPGVHIRLVLEVDPLGAIAPVAAAELPGDAFPMAPFPLPDVGALICVLKSPLPANMPEQVYHVGMTPNPFEERSYDPPETIGGAHGSEDLPRVRTRCPLPLLSEERGLEGLVVQFLRYARPADAEVLDPDTVLRNPDSFLRFPGRTHRRRHQGPSRGQR